MELHKGIKIVDLALYIEIEKTLVLADLHIGLEEAINKEGYLIPRIQVNEITKRLKDILSKIDVKTIIINGDLKHEFGEISKQEWRDTLRIFDFLKKYNVILIKGNHDKILGPIAEKKNIKIKDYYNLGAITITHGDKIIPNLSKIIIIGHEHPAISFKERPDEKYKCFLKGKWKNKILIVQPSFNFVSEGSDVTKESLLSPFLQNLNNFEVYVVEDRNVLYFDKLKNIPKFLQ